MTPRLFVDVDDTLILWPKVSEGSALVGGPPKPNVAVVEFVRRWQLFHREGEVIVWSLGGKDYAAKWRAEVIPSATAAWCKEPIPVSPGDMFLDDDPLPFYRHRTIHPDMLASMGVPERGVRA